MKKIFYLLYIALAFVGCNDDDDKLPRITPEATGTFTDTDGQVYKWVRYNGIDWMASNYKGGEPYYNATNRWGDDLIDIDNKELAIADFEIYGNLYTYEQATGGVYPRTKTGKNWNKPWGCPITQPTKRDGAVPGSANSYNKTKQVAA